MTSLWRVTHLIPVFGEVTDANVVDHVAGPDEEGDAVTLQQLEVVVVGLVAQKALDMIWNEEGEEAC